jgi:hypothetical protein
MVEGNGEVLGKFSVRMWRKRRRRRRARGVGLNQRERERVWVK